MNEPKKVKSEVKKPTKSAPPKTVTEKVEKAAEKIEKSVNKENVENGLDDGKCHFYGIFDRQKIRLDRTEKQIKETTTTTSCLSCE